MPTIAKVKLSDIASIPTRKRPLTTDQKFYDEAVKGLTLDGDPVKLTITGSETLRGVSLSIHRSALRNGINDLFTRLHGSDVFAYRSSKESKPAPKTDAQKAKAKATAAKRKAEKESAASAAATPAKQSAA